MSEDESLETIFTKLNTHYHQRLAAPVGSSFTSGGGFFGWGRKKHVHADTDPISRPSSAVGVTRPAGMASRSVVTQRMAASEPVSREGSVRDVPGAIETANGGGKPRTATSNGVQDLSAPISYSYCRARRARIFPLSSMGW